MPFQIRAVISKWGTYFQKGHNSSPLKCVWFLPGSKAPCSLKHLRDNLTQANCDVGNMYVNFLNKLINFTIFFNWWYWDTDGTPTITLDYIISGRNFNILTKYFMHFSSRFILGENVICIHAIFSVAISFISYA